MLHAAGEFAILTERYGLVSSTNRLTLETQVSAEYSGAMKSSTIVIAFLMVGFVYCCPALAQCPPILTRAQGTVSGEVRGGDVLFLKFIYSRKRVESSSPQQAQGQMFTVTGAYSTFKRRGIFVADVCGGYPRQIQLVMQDKNGVTLDTVDLTARDPSNGVSEMNYGKTQTIVLHRPSVPAR